MAGLLRISHCVAAARCYTGKLACMVCRQCMADHRLSSAIQDDIQKYKALKSMVKAEGSEMQVLFLMMDWREAKAAVQRHCDEWNDKLAAAVQP